jgi:hypothetical protein
MQLTCRRLCTGKESEVQCEAWLTCGRAPVYEKILVACSEDKSMFAVSSRCLLARQLTSKCCVRTLVRRQSC